MTPNAYVGTRSVQAEWALGHKAKGKNVALEERPCGHMTRTRGGGLEKRIEGRISCLLSLSSWE